jgi:hypothetical protein
VSHLDERSREARQAEEIIRAEVERFERMLETRSVVPAIVALQQQFERVRQDEHRRIESKLRSLTPEQRSAVEALTRGLVNKVLHQPLRAMKAAARSGDMSVVEAVREIFSLQETALQETALQETGLQEPAIEETGLHDGDPHRKSEGTAAGLAARGVADASVAEPEAATSGKATAAQPRDAKAEEIRFQESRR